MKASETPVQRAILAALRKLNTGATFRANVCTLGAQETTDPTVNRGSWYLRQTIELILEEFEKEEQGN
jgi:hypothetical protein